MNGFEIDLLPVTCGDKSGDCIAFRYGDLNKGGDDQTVVVVDGGYVKNASEMKAHLKKYYNCVTPEGKIRIDLMIASHSDGDHVGGLAALAEDDEIEIINFWGHIPQREMNAWWYADKRHTTSSVRTKLDEPFSLLSTIADKLGRDSLLNPYQGWIINEAEFTILSPTPDFYKKCIANSKKAELEPDVKVEPMKYPASTNSDTEEEDYIKGKIQWDYNEGTSAINESSLVFLFEYDGVRILFCGDAGREAMENALDHAENEGVDLTGLTLIKQPHHGSRKNVTPEIMSQISAKFCFISCTKNDEGHHPSKRLVNMLNEKGFRVFTTSGSTLHWGKNAPDRNWNDAKQMTSFDKIEKRKEYKR